MKYCNKSFESEAELKNFISECENDFEGRLDKTASELASEKGLRLIALAGPTCAGKTKAANKLISTFRELGREVHVISLDDFFREMTDVGRDTEEEVDFDSVNALDMPEFIRFTDDIFSGKVLKVPHFDFVTRSRSGYTELEVTDDDIFIFEGIQAVYPEITERIHRLKSKSVFICPKESLDVGGTVFNPNEIRYMRRIVRDSIFRASMPEYSMFLWGGVRKNEELSIFPNAEKCDFHIDSLMPYEVNVLAGYLVPLLENIPNDSAFRDDADTILEKIKDISPIDKSFIPSGSLYYEFIK